jgi:hypothetical protein
MTDAAKLLKFPTVDLLFPSKYIKAADLKGQKVAVTIESIDPRQKLKMKDNTEKLSPVLTLVGKQKSWVLNVTNALAIAEVFGNELAGWIGKTVVIFPTRVQFGTRIVDAIRVNIEETARRANITLVRHDETTGEVTEDLDESDFVEEGEETAASEPAEETAEVKVARLKAELEAVMNGNAALDALAKAPKPKGGKGAKKTPAPAAEEPTF